MNNREIGVRENVDQIVPAAELPTEIRSVPLNGHVNGAVKGRVVKSSLSRKLWTFLMVFGPGLIVMQADNDAGALSTYTQAGAQYGMGLLWVLLLLLPATYFCQEMVARLGIATGRGHARMIYTRFGKWWGRFSLVDLELVNFLTLVTEFAAIDLALSRIGVPAVVSVPVAAIGLIAMVVTGSYLRWERIAVTLCFLDAAWFAFALVGKPALGDVLRGTFVPQIPRGELTPSLMFMVIAIVGTTIAPWQLFFQQSCVADKKLKFSHLSYSRLDILAGAVFMIGSAGAMLLVGDVLLRNNLPYEDPAQMADVLGPLLGPGVKYGVLMLMVNAAVLGATAISLASSWAYAEVVGWEHSLQKGIKGAPGFYTVYIVAIAAAAGIVLIPNAPLQLIILGVQVLAGLMLPSAIIFLQLLLNDRELLGAYANKRWNNWINWTIIIVLFALSAILAVQVMVPSLFPTT